MGLAFPFRELGIELGRAQGDAALEIHGHAGAQVFRRFADLRFALRAQALEIFQDLGLLRGKRGNRGREIVFALRQDFHLFEQHRLAILEREDFRLELGASGPERGLYRRKAFALAFGQRRFELGNAARAAPLQIADHLVAELLG